MSKALQFAYDYTENSSNTCDKMPGQLVEVVGCLDDGSVYEVCFAIIATNGLQFWAITGGVNDTAIDRNCGSLLVEGPFDDFAETLLHIPEDERRQLK